MKSHCIKIATILAALIVMGGRTLVADESTASRLVQIQEDLKRRRTQREEAFVQRGVVCAPVVSPEKWFGPEGLMRVSDEQIATCAQNYAILIGKEVMVSGSVAKRRISIPEGTTLFKEFAEATHNAFTAQGVIEVPIGDRIVALVDSKYMRNEN